MDGVYFRRGSTWGDRLRDWLAQQTTGKEFLEANAAAIERWLGEHGCRIVVNAPAIALLAILNGDKYKNKYELARIGQASPPSERRVVVDQLLGFVPDGRDWYFGAVAVGGAGVRFYGEYCLVLKKTAAGAPRLL